MYTQQVYKLSRNSKFHSSLFSNWRTFPITLSSSFLFQFFIQRNELDLSWIFYGWAQDLDMIERETLQNLFSFNLLTEMQTFIKHWKIKEWNNTTEKLRATFENLTFHIDSSVCTDLTLYAFCIFFHIIHTHFFLQFADSFFVYLFRYILQHNEDSEKAHFNETNVFAWLCVWKLSR